MQITHQTFTEKHNIDNFNRMDKRSLSRDVEHHVVNSLNKLKGHGFNLKHVPSGGPKEAPYDAIDVQYIDGKEVNLKVEIKTLCKQYNGALTAAHIGKHWKKIDYFVFYENIQVCDKEFDVFYVSKYQPMVTFDLVNRNNDSATFNKNGRQRAGYNYDDLQKCDKFIFQNNNTVTYEKGDRSFGSLSYMKGFFEWNWSSRG